MDEGPEPMINMKKARKVDNAVDQFHNAHQAAYEAREKPSRDEVQRVKDHNMAYPLLRDELDNRRDTRKAIAVHSTFTRKCSACDRYHERTQLKKNNNRRRKNNVGKRKKSHPNRKENVTKNKRIYDKKDLYLRSSPHITRRPKHYVMKNKNVGPDRRSYAPLNLERSKHKVVDIFMAKDFDKLPSEKEVSTSQPERTRKVQTEKEVSTSKPGRNIEVESIATSGYPDTSNPSFGSYHSYGSMEKEPMVD